MSFDYCKCTVGEPSVMWLAGLTVPESYLAAVVQRACQKYFWPLEHTTLYATVTPYTNHDEIAERPKTVIKLLNNF